jgi:hypothetical protein
VRRINPTSAVLSKSAGESRGKTGDMTSHAELWC